MTAPCVIFYVISFSIKPCEVSVIFAVVGKFLAFIFSLCSSEMGKKKDESRHYDYFGLLIISVMIISGYLKFEL